MSTGFTYDVIVRSYASNMGQYFAEELNKRSLKAIDFSYTTGPRDKDARKLEAALQNSRIMILILDVILPDKKWLVLEKESKLFRDPRHSEKKLIIIRTKGAPLKPGLEDCLHFDWTHAERDFHPIYLACLPETTFAETPTSTAEDCPLKRLFSFGHTAGITAISISADSKKAITAAHDNTLRLWQLDTGRSEEAFERGERKYRCERVFEQGGGKYNAVSLHPKEPLAVSGDSQGNLICWDLDTGEPLYTLKGHTGAVNSVCWSPDGNRILSGSSDGALRIWQDKTCLRTLTGHIKAVNSVSWGIHDQLLSGSDDHTIRIWDADKGDQLYEFNLQQEVQDVSYSPNVKYYFTRLKHGQLQIWNSKANDPLPAIADEAGKPMSIRAASWGPDDNSILLSPHIGQEILVRDLSNGKQEKKFSQAWNFRARCLAWSRDGRFCLLGRTDGAIQVWNMDKKHLSFYSDDLGHHGALCRTALSPDGSLLVSGAADESARLWNFETGECESTLQQGHKGNVCGLAWSPDNRFVVTASQKNKDLRLSGLDLDLSPYLLKGQGQPAQVDWGPDIEVKLPDSSASFNPRDYILGASNDRVLRLWHKTKQDPLNEFRGHRAALTAVKWSPDGRHALSGSQDTTIKLWEVFPGKEIGEWGGHNGAIMDLSWSPDSTQAVSASADRTLRIWDVSTGRCLQILEGHTAVVLSVSWSPDGRFLASGGEDKTVRIWDAHSGECLYELRDPTEKVITVAWTHDSQTLLASAANGVMRILDVSVLQSRPQTTTIRAGYSIAKVMICGNSGVGKTALACWLAHNKYENTTSTDGVWATQCHLPDQSTDIERQIWLWDFAGQTDYRLVHQLFMQDADVVVLVFDPQDKNPFEKLESWVQDLQKLQSASLKPFTMLLAAGRIDRGRLWVSENDVNQWMKKNRFHGRLHLTSAANKGQGCDALRDAIVEAIDWPGIPVINAPALYTRLKQEILSLRDSGELFINLADLNTRLELALKGRSFTFNELDTVITSLTRTGIIRRLDFGNLILLKPEILSRYAGALVRKVHNQPNEMGYIDEQDLYDGNLDYQSLDRLPEEQERAILIILYGLLTQQPWTLRQTTANGRSLIIFPTYFRRERPASKGQPDVAHSYHFRGPADEIYASLVVHLSHTETFLIDELWRDSADFKTPDGRRLGLRLVDNHQGNYRLDIWFQSTQTDNTPPVDETTRQLFLQYVYKQISLRAQDVSQPPKEEPGWVEIEPQLVQMEENIAITLTNLDKEGQLIGLVWYLASSAGQIFHLVSWHDVGIDGDIQFIKPNKYPSAKRIYLQLKSGDSYLRQRRRDGKEIFQIKKAWHVDFWKEHTEPVMLVIRTTDHGIRWMNVKDYIDKEEAAGQTNITQILFDGEPLNAESILEWRDKTLGLDKDPTSPV